jgi:hypothetical protein
MSYTPLVRHLWTMYKKLLACKDIDTRDLVLAQDAFYTVPAGSLKSRPVCSSAQGTMRCTP